MIIATAGTNPPMTTVSMPLALRKHLEEQKIHPRETMDDVIQRLLETSAWQKASP